MNQEKAYDELLNSSGFGKNPTSCLKRSERTAKEKVWYIRKFLKAMDKKVSEMSKEDIRSYLKGLNGVGAATYSNMLKSLKVFFRDFLNKSEIV